MLRAQSLAWTSLVGDGSADHCNTSVDLAEIIEERRLVSYVAKYLAKVATGRWIDPQTGEILTTGRCWGVMGDRTLMDRGALEEHEWPDQSAAREALRSFYVKEGLKYGTFKEADAERSYSVFTARSVACGASELLRPKREPDRDGAGRSDPVCEPG